MKPRRLFVAGATGAVGRTLVRLARPSDALVPHVRPASASSPAAPPGAAVFDLSDSQALERALAGCTTVLQLIGTMRRRFAQGDTYESSDVGTTLSLVNASLAAGVDHFVLLSSMGAGRPVGSYLRAKSEAEALVRDSGLPFTVVRPSAFVGEGHSPPELLHLVTRLPGLTRFRPIGVDALARVLLHIGRSRAPLGETLEGERLWSWVAEAGKQV